MWKNRSPGKASNDFDTRKGNGEHKALTYKLSGTPGQIDPIVGLTAPFLLIFDVRNTIKLSETKRRKNMETNAASTASATVAKEEDGKPPVKADEKADPSTVDMPWHKDARFQDFLKEKKQLLAANEKLQKLLKENDLDDPDDLEDLVKSGKTVKGKLADLNQIDELIAKATKLDSYEAYWAADKDRREREETDPVTRAERAERKLADTEQRRRFEEDKKRKTEEAKSAIRNYEKEVTSLIKELGHQKDQEPFILEMFGVGNPSNDVDIYDKKAIKRLVAEGQKKVEAFKQSVIAEYLKEKKGIVKTGQGAESVGGDKPPKIMLKDARKIFLETMQRGASGG